MNLQTKEKPLKDKIKSFKAKQSDSVAISYISFFGIWPMSLMALILLIKYNHEPYLTLFIPTIIITILSICAMTYNIKNKYIHYIVMKIYYSLMLVSTLAWIIVIPFCIIAFLNW